MFSGAGGFRKLKKERNGCQRDQVDGWWCQLLQRRPTEEGSTRDHHPCARKYQFGAGPCGWCEAWHSPPSPCAAHAHLRCRCCSYFVHQLLGKLQKKFERDEYVYFSLALPFLLFSLAWESLVLRHSALSLRTLSLMGYWVFRVWVVLSLTPQSSCSTPLPSPFFAHAPFFTSLWVEEIDGQFCNSWNSLFAGHIDNSVTNQWRLQIRLCNSTFLRWTIEGQRLLLHFFFPEKTGIWICLVVFFHVKWRSGCMYVPSAYVCCIGFFLWLQTCQCGAILWCVTDSHFVDCCNCAALSEYISALEGIKHTQASQNNNRLEEHRPLPYSLHHLPHPQQCAVCHTDICWHFNIPDYGESEDCHNCHSL